MNNKPFLVKGICYSPVPINASVYWDPLGDYFSEEYSYIWLRDLPLMKAMGANVVRIYGWDSDKDHTPFLDAVRDNGLYLMTTFFMGEAVETPVNTATQRANVIKRFQKAVKQYRHHPALLIWSIGNEINGVWNGFLQQLSNSEVDPCGWDETYDDLGGCWTHLGIKPIYNSQCYNTSLCVYKRLYGFLNDCAVAAHELADVIVTSTFADVDALYDKVERMGQFAPDLDAWSAQVYRGASFGDFFTGISNSTGKPLLLTEYGVDAYHDVCGKDRNDKSPCFNTLDDDSGSYIDEAAQAEYGANLTREIYSHRSDLPNCTNIAVGDTRCACAGGFLMSWVDEFWKGAKVQAGCKPAYPDPDFSTATCDDKAHVTCGNWDTSQHDLCGYFLDAAPDGYVNEEWFGILEPKQCADGIDSLQPREIFFTMHELWNDEGTERPEMDLFPSCHQIVEQTCAELGTPGNIHPWVERVLLLLGRGYNPRHTWNPMASTPRNHTHYHGVPVCSGHGRCTTDDVECGKGSATKKATPCCTCELGFAGEGCAELDARMYVAIFVLTIATMMLTSMLLISIGRRSIPQLKRPSRDGTEMASKYQEPLLS